MLELIVAISLISGALLASRLSGRSGFEADGDSQQLIDLSESDLPCPWCYGPTSLDDDRCPNCDQRFG